MNKPDPAIIGGPNLPTFTVSFSHEGVTASLQLKVEGHDLPLQSMPHQDEVRQLLDACCVASAALAPRIAAAVHQFHSEFAQSLQLEARRSYSALFRDSLDQEEDQTSTVPGASTQGDQGGAA